MSHPTVCWNFALRLAAAVSLATLALALLAGLDPLGAVARAMPAFVAFVCLGWVVSQLVRVPEPVEEAKTPAATEPAPASSAPTVITQAEA